MPKVPSYGVVGPPSVGVDQTDMMMAAAQMHSEGRLFEPEPLPSAQQQGANIVSAAQTQERNARQQANYPALYNRSQRGRR